MTLHDMVYQRMASSEKLKEMLASFGNLSAVFHQLAPPADNPMWSEHQYPRIDYSIDMMDNPSRNANGILIVNIWCDSNHYIVPEDVEPVVKELFHSSFVNADDEIYSFAWVRSDPFDAEYEHNTRTTGVSLRFDIIACPCQYTTYPDPVKAMNLWAKSIIPSAIVIGEDLFDGWISPTRETPVVYWRLASQGIERRQFVCTWMNVTLEGHICATNSADRLCNLTKLNTAQAFAGHITMEDSSPLFLKSFSVKPHLNYLSQGQIQASGYFGILKPANMVESRSTGKPLVHLHPFERETAGECEFGVRLSNAASTPYRFPYVMSGEASAGEHPEQNLIAAGCNKNVETASTSADAFSISYPQPTNTRYTEGE